MPSSDPTAHVPSPWHASSQQRVFRRLLECFAYPGRIAAWDGFDSALTALLATLVDGEVDLADPHRLVAADDWPKLQARRGLPETAAFVVADGARPPDFVPRLGTLESPELGATLILSVAAVGVGEILHLDGPGVHAPAELAVSGLHPSWMRARAEWVAPFPMGVDLILCDGQRFAALPRTTQVESTSPKPESR